MSIFKIFGFTKHAPFVFIVALFYPSVKKKTVGQYNPKKANCHSEPVRTLAWESTKDCHTSDIGHWFAMTMKLSLFDKLFLALGAGDGNFT
ncbi:MAG: hypothetical protein IKY18_07140, partial [Oscillospiraceae bacterium]|nr:hypothetical protein [Oscillospiraceae bacterium]